MRDLCTLCISTLVFALLAPGLALSGQIDSSAQPPAPAPEAPLAHVTALQGSQAFIEHQGQVARAQIKQPIYAGDRFFTGQNSRMRVAFDRGGLVDLDENTDPSLKVDIECLFIRAFRLGAIYVSGARICLENAPNAVAQYSDVGYRILPQEGAPGILRITVIQGEVRTLQPPGVTVAAGQQLDLQNGQVLKGPYPSTDQDRQDATSWRRFADRHVPSWLAPVGIGAALGVIGAFAGHGHDNHEPGSSEQPGGTWARPEPDQPEVPPAATPPPAVRGN